MAVTITKNLKLRIDSSLTANSKWNLSRIDELGGTFFVDKTGTVRLRSQSDIVLLPNDASLDGSGEGGSVSIGLPSQPVDSFEVNAEEFLLTKPLSLKDQAAGSQGALALSYDSTLDGSVDNTSRHLALDVEGADRKLVLGGDLKVKGGSLELTLPADGSYTLPSSGALVTTSAAQTLTGKSIDGASNTVTGLTNSAIAAAAGIAYSKLNLSASIKGSDVAPDAAIAYSSLNLSGSVKNSDVSASAGIAYSKLDLSGGIVNTDVSGSAGIAYSKLNLAGSIKDADVAASANIARSKLSTDTPNSTIINDGSGKMIAVSALPQGMGGTGVQGSATFPTSGVVVTETASQTLTNKSIDGNANSLSNIPYAALDLAGAIYDSDVAANAGISYSKLDLTGGIVNADVASNAAIAGTKISPDFGDQVVRTLRGIQFEEGGYKTFLQMAQADQSADWTLTLPTGPGTDGQILVTNGSGTLRWETVTGTGTVTSIDVETPDDLLSSSGGPVTAAGTITLDLNEQEAGKVFAGPVTGDPAKPTFRSLEVSDLAAFDTDDIPEGSSNLYYTDERVDDRVSELLVAGDGIGLTYNDADGELIITSTITQYTDEMAEDAVGNILTDTVDIEFTYNDTDGEISAVLSETGVDADTYGSASSVAVIGVDAKGRITAAESTPISIDSSAITDFSEAAQDAVGTILVDSSSIDFTYTDATPSITATVLPGGVDHDQLLNFVANEHVDHSTVSIATSSTSGLSGGGNITSTRNLSVSPTSATLKASPVSADEILLADSEDSAALKKATLGSLAEAIGMKSHKETWETADGSTFEVSHNLGTVDVIVQVFDLADGSTILVDTIERTDSDTITLTASEAPGASGWRVLVLAI